MPTVALVQSVPSLGKEDGMEPAITVALAALFLAVLVLGLVALKK